MVPPSFFSDCKATRTNMLGTEYMKFIVNKKNSHHIVWIVKYFWIFPGAQWYGIHLPRRKHGRDPWSGKFLHALEICLSHNYTTKNKWITKYNLFQNPPSSKRAITFNLISEVFLFPNFCTFIIPIFTSCKLGTCYKFHFGTSGHWKYNCSVMDRVWYNNWSANY